MVLKLLAGQFWYGSALDYLGGGNRDDADLGFVAGGAEDDEAVGFRGEAYGRVVFGAEEVDFYAAVVLRAELDGSAVFFGFVSWCTHELLLHSLVRGHALPRFAGTPVEAIPLSAAFPTASRFYLPLYDRLLQHHHFLDDEIHELLRKMTAGDFPSKHARVLTPHQSPHADKPAAAGSEDAVPEAC